MSSISPLSAVSLQDYRTRQHSTTDNITRHSVVVETNQTMDGQSYLFCAHVTGLTGEMGYGEDESFEAQQDMSEGYRQWWQAHGLQISLNDGTSSPVDVLESSHFFNDGYGNTVQQATPSTRPAYTTVAVYCDQELPDYVLREFIERSHDFMKGHDIEIENIQIAQDHIITNSTIERTERSVTFK